jgi:gas vesicle protein
MSNKKRKVQNWARTAVKLGLLLTDPKVRNTITDTFKEHVEDVSDAYSDVSSKVTSKYEDVMDRLESVTDRFQSKNPWPARVGGFLMGVGVGVGLGILFAPASGEETRESFSGVKDRVVESATGMKDRVVESASNMTNKIRSTVTSMPATGTEG